MHVANGAILFPYYSQVLNGACLYVLKAHFFLAECTFLPKDNLSSTAGKIYRTLVETYSKGRHLRAFSTTLIPAWLNVRNHSKIVFMEDAFHFSFLQLSEAIDNFIP